MNTLNTKHLLAINTEMATNDILHTSTIELIGIINIFPA